MLVKEIFIVKFFEFIILTLISYLMILFNRSEDSFYSIYKKYFLKDNFNNRFLNKIDGLLNKVDIKIFNFTKSKLFLMCFFVGIFFYFVSFLVVKLKFFNFIFGVIGLFIPFIVLDFIIDKKDIQIRNNFTNMVLQLRNYAQIQNDVMFCFKSVQNDVSYPFDLYIKEFLVHVNSGDDVVNSFQIIKEKVDFKIGKCFFDNICFCLVYGGDFKKLLNKTYQIMKDINEEQRKRKLEMKSAAIILYIMIFLDFLVYFTYVKSNKIYMDILQNSFIGNVVLLINIISIIFVIWLASYVKKIEK